jgi:organic hydroperoxide reductase OsmC/OhrA
VAKYTASIAWHDDGGFPTGRYSRAHELRFDGGAVVRGSSSPHIVPLPFSDPAGVDPEEALIASASACHMLWFLNLAQEAGLHVTRYEDEAEAVMERVGRGKQAITRIVLRPRIAFAGRKPGADELKALHHEAHERCFIANSLRSDIVVEAPARPELDPAK